MPLHELQSDVMDALFERSARAESHVRGGGRLSPQQRLGIYRHNLVDSLGAALAAVYPTVAQLVGEDFFRYAARAYIAAHPSLSGNLHDFGGELAHFLAHFEPARSLPYLPDSARLDWAWHQVFHTTALPGADAAQMLGRLAALSDEDRLDARLQWQPAAQLVRSPYPVLRIWQANQPDAADETVDLGLGGECVLVAARRGEVVLQRLEAAEHALLLALAQGTTLGDAVAAALGQDAGFDVAGVLAQHIAAGTLVRLANDP
jgi:hypothetical protein